MKITKKNLRNMVKTQIAEMLEDNDRFKDLPGYEEYADGEKIKRRRQQAPEEQTPDESYREDDPVFRDHLEEAGAMDRIFLGYKTGIHSALSGAIFDALEEMGIHKGAAQDLSGDLDQREVMEAVFSGFKDYIRKVEISGAAKPRLGMEPGIDEVAAHGENRKAGQNAERERLRKLAKDAAAVALRKDNLKAKAKKTGKPVRPRIK
tara:strand:+ start:681 stop:1298 length:618 start_codon:yes stop_codon:yes gene_type:complete